MTTGLKRKSGRKPVKSSSGVSLDSLMGILDLQGYKCALSGEELTPALASIDHKVPRAMDGKNDVNNLHVVLCVVNKAKGTMTVDQFVSMCHAVARCNKDPGDQSWKAFRFGTTA
jgi:hypothetical protein